MKGYNCFSRETAPIFKRKKHGAAYFIIPLVALFLVCHAIIINFLVLCFTFSCKLYKKGPEIVTLFLVSNSAANPLVDVFLKSGS